MALEPPELVDARLLGDLERKYRTLAEVHRALAAWDDAGARRLDRPLAREFPGALRELQTLSLDEIEARRTAIAEATARGSAEPWMRWMHGYHTLLRVALRLKLRFGARRAGQLLDEGAAEALARSAGAAEGVAVDVAFVRAVASPPGGRIADVVLARLAALHGTSARTVADALFPSRRTRI